MKNLLAALVLFMVVGKTYGQNDCVSLAEALKDPSNTEGISFSPADNISKFIKRRDKFSDLQTVYIQRGFTALQLQNLVGALKTIEAGELIVECDTLALQIGIIATLENIDKITLLEPYVLRTEALLDIARLKNPALCLKSSDKIELPKDFSFPPQLEEIEILTKNASGNNELLSKLTGHKKLVSVFFSLDSISVMPVAIGELTSLKNLELIKAPDIDRADDLKSTQKFRMAREANECKQLISINYDTDEPMTWEEKQTFTKVFNGFYFVGGVEKEIKIADAETQANRIITTDNTVFPIDKAFNPIVEGIKIPRTTFIVNVEKPVKIGYSSGTIINIPANAFATADGKPVNGEVKVSYREIKTPVEMLAAGVDMAYDSAGTTYQFQSAGNFELLASQNGEPLELAKGKEIKVDFLSTDEGNYNLYKYDEQTQNWNFEKPANQKPVVPNTPKNEKEAMQVKEKKGNTQLVTDIDSSILFAMVDCTPFSQRFASTNYRYMLDSGVRKGDVLEMYKSKRKGQKFDYCRTIQLNTQTAFVKLKLASGKEVKNDSLHQVKFTIVAGTKYRYINNSKIPIYKYFPELAVYKNQVFYTEELMTKKEFRKLFIRGKKYFDVRIDYVPGESTSTIQLKSDSGIVKVVADLTVGKSAGQSKVTTFKRRYKRYAKYLDNRIQRLNNGLETKKAKAMEDVYGIRTADLSRYRSIGITGLGLFNCDHGLMALFRLDINVGYTIKPSVIEGAVITTSEGSEINPVYIYVLDNEINGVLTYNPAKVEYRKKTATKMLAIDKDKNIYGTYLPVNEAVTGNKILMRPMDKNNIQNINQLGTELALEN